jgi:predicted metal-dependent phosphoesterase TrpH
LVSAALTLKTTHVVAVDGAHPSDVDSGEGLLLVQATDELGRSLPVRVRVLRGKTFVRDRVVHARTGRSRTKLAPGSYEIVVSHGPEWSIHEQTIVIVAGQQQTISVRLSRELDFSAFTSCDLHVHTDASPDSDLSVAGRVDTLLAEDVGFAILTDHNHVALSTSELVHAGIAALPGAEITTWDPEFGHFNAFPLREAPPYKHTNVSELLRALRANPSTFVQINHPRLERHIGYFELEGFERGKASELLRGFDGVEVWNGYEQRKDAARDQVFLDWLTLLHEGHRLTATGSSDSHHADRAPFAGYPRTYVRVPRAEAHDTTRVLAALKAGHAFVSNGPRIDLHVEGRVPGQTLRSHGHFLSVRVDVAAARFMQLDEIELWLGAQRVATARVPRARAGARAHEASIELTIPVAHERTLVATVRGKGSMRTLLGVADARPYAFTNPVYLTPP